MCDSVGGVVEWRQQHVRGPRLYHQLSSLMLQVANQLPSCRIRMPHLESSNARRPLTLCSHLRTQTIPHTTCAHLNIHLQTAHGDPSCLQPKVGVAEAQHAANKQPCCNRTDCQHRPASCRSCAGGLIVSSMLLHAARRQRCVARGEGRQHLPLAPSCARQAAVESVSQKPTGDCWCAVVVGVAVPFVSLCGGVLAAAQHTTAVSGGKPAAAGGLSGASVLPWGIRSGCSCGSLTGCGTRQGGVAARVGGSARRRCQTGTGCAVTLT